MASIISAGTTSATALNMSADTSGVLQLASNNGTVGLTLDTSQRVLLGTTASGSSLVQATQAGINATSLTTTTVKNLGVKLGFTGVSNTDGYIFGGVAMGGSGEEYAGIAAYDNGSSAATGLKLFTGTTSAIVEAVNIDSVGRVTTPLQPAFKAYPSSNISVSSGVTNLTFDSTSYNVGSHYSTSTGLFTAPVAGVYFFEAATYIASVPDGYYGIRFSVNGSNAQDAYVRGGFGDCTPAFTFVRYLSANDTVRISSYYNSSATIYAGVPASHFSGYLLG